MWKLFCLSLVCWPAFVHGQFTYVIDQTIPVDDLSDTPYVFPWAGGLNAPQTNTLDLNQDGIDDLVLFDRMANKPITFLREADHYVYKPEYESLFPDLANWLLIRDYDCDGRKDIFTGDVLGIRVFRNLTTDGPLLWGQYFFFTQPGSPKSSVLLTKGFSGLINLQLQFDDLPSISDMDNDGDLDILSMRFQGQGSVEFHKNFSKELYGNCDSLVFERTTQSWGNWKECACGIIAFNGEECPPASGGRIKHAGGKALLAFDFDNDQDQDLLFSEGECTQLFLLENQGDADNPVFSTAVNYPAANPPVFFIFPTPFLEDVDFDGVRDLIVIPNVYAKELLEIDLKHSNWLYRNTGTQELPEFTFQRSDFMQSGMIDVGDNAVPAFFDIDGDNDLDMIIGQDNTDGESTGSLTLYENTGTPATPVFKFVTDNYLDFKSFLLYNIKPQFYDVNTDGKIDLVFSATSSTLHQTGMYTLINKSSTGLDFSGQPLNPVSFDMLFTENFHMTDVDADGMPDVIVGRSNGSVQFWRNNGPSGAINLTLTQDNFLGLGPSVERQSLALFSSDLNADDKPDLVLGDQYGHLSVVSDFRQTNDEVVLLNDIVFNPISGTYGSPDLGGRIWPTAADLFNQTKPAILVGNILGGVQILRNDQRDTLPPGPGIEIYPNPVRGTDMLNIKVDRQATIQILSLLGQELTEPVPISPNQPSALSLPRLSSGLYILRVVVGGGSFSRRVVVY